MSSRLELIVDGVELMMVDGSLVYTELSTHPNHIEYLVSVSS